ncbi:MULTISPECIES: hypothetical protein [unclassified Bradyrhizobium]
MTKENTAGSDGPFTPPELLRSFNEMQRKMSAVAAKEVLGFAASRLQDQADYLTSLAGCTSSSEALKCQWDFAQRSWSKSLIDGWKMFDTFNAKRR